MIAEIAANNRSNEVYRAIAMHVTGRSAPETSSKPGNLKLPELFRKRKQA
jgi:pilus assembly protein CpaE